MKRILISAGLFAFMASALHAAYAPGLTALEKQKPWSISAAIRGFYDSNYTTSPPTLARSSFGFEFSPALSINLPMEQTFFGASYVYSMKYYQDRVNLDQPATDNSHQFNFKVDHAFSERYKINASDSFVIAQEPEILNAGGVVTAPLRQNGNNIRNTFATDFSARVTELLDVQIAYANNYYDYQQTGPASYSASLNRVENLPAINLRYQWQPKTILVLGYTFGIVNYLSGDSLAPAGSPFVSPTVRNNYSDYLYVGADQSFTEQLNGSLRVGAQYVDYYNSSANILNPYIDGSLTYTYAPGSYLQSGVRHARSQTDVTTTLDQEATTLYLSLTHRITGLLTGNLLGMYQNSAFNDQSVPGVPGNDTADNYFVASVNLAYRLDRAGHWMAETGYTYDKLNSSVPNRPYTRDRVYIGIRGTY